MIYLSLEIERKIESTVYIYRSHSELLEAHEQSIVYAINMYAKNQLK